MSVGNESGEDTKPVLAKETATIPIEPPSVDEDTEATDATTTHSQDISALANEPESGPSRKQGSPATIKPQADATSVHTLGDLLSPTKSEHDSDASRRTSSSNFNEVALDEEETTRFSTVPLSEARTSVSSNAAIKSARSSLDSSGQPVSNTTGGKHRKSESTSSEFIQRRAEESTPGRKSEDGQRELKEAFIRRHEDHDAAVAQTIDWGMCWVHSTGLRLHLDEFDLFNW